MKFRAIIMLQISLTMSSCGSSMVRDMGIANAQHYGRPYWGVRNNLCLVVTGGGIGEYKLLPSVLAIVDAPFSFLLDTILLPADLVHSTPPTGIGDCVGLQEKKRRRKEQNEKTESVLSELPPIK